MVARKPPSTTAGPLVELDHGEAWTTSRLVAEKFGKKHSDVIRAIKKKRCSPEFARRNFALSEYVDRTGRTVPMYRLSRDGFSLVVMGFTGEAAVAWQERFIAAFNKMERELRRIAENKALPDWKEARQLGKAERRELTDVVQEHALNAQARGDSTTPVERWIMAATKTVSAALFENEFCESISGIRERLTPRQLRRLAMAEEVYAGAIASYLDSGLHHKLVNAEAKRAVLAFASMTGGKEVPGVDVSARMRLGRAAPRRLAAEVC